MRQRAAMLGANAIFIAHAGTTTLDRGWSLTSHSADRQPRRYCTQLRGLAVVSSRPAERRARMLSNALVSGMCALMIAFFVESANAQTASSIEWISRPSAATAQNGRISAQLRVLPRAGESVAGMAVTLAATIDSAMTRSDRDVDITTAQADANGLVVFNDIPVRGAPRVLFLAARTGSGISSLPIRVLVEAGIADEIALVGSVPIMVENGSYFSPSVRVVVKANGSPLAGATVTVQVAATVLVEGGIEQADANGKATFAHLRLIATCPNRVCPSAVIRFVAGSKETPSTTIALLPKPATQLLIIEGASREAHVGAPLDSAIRVKALDADNKEVEGVTIVARAPLMRLHDTLAVTGPNGVAVFAALTLTGRARQVPISFSTQGAQVNYSLHLAAGDGERLRITTQPAGRLTYDSAFLARPVVRVLDVAGNVVSAAEVQAELCQVVAGDTKGRVRLDGLVGLDVKARSCAMQTVITGSLTGQTSVHTDSSGSAEFRDLRFRGGAGVYLMRFRLPANDATVETGLMVYDPVRDYDQNYVAISAIKTISGVTPQNEFFDLRFRFRLHDDYHLLAATDLALSNRGTDSVTSSSKRLTEATLLLNRNIYFARAIGTDVPQRLLYAGGGLKVFNTIPYYGPHIGGIEMGGSPFQGSSLTVGYYQRLFSDTTTVVDSDTLSLARSNIGIDFYLRSSTLEFFKILTIRGTVFLPMVAHGQVSSRIAVAVPVGDIHVF